MPMLRGFRNARIESYISHLTGGEYNKIGDKLVVYVSELPHGDYKTIADELESMDDEVVITLLGNNRLIIESQLANSIKSILESKLSDPEKVKDLLDGANKLKEESDDSNEEFEVDDLYKEILQESFDVNPEGTQELLDSYQYKDPSLKNIQDFFDEMRDTTEELRDDED